MDENAENDGGGLSRQVKHNRRLKHKPKIENTGIVRLQIVKHIFLKMGWRKSYIEATLTMKDVPLLEVETNKDFINMCISAWYPKNAINMSFEYIFKACGLKHSTYRKVMRVIAPLFDTCYGTQHLYDIAMEYLVSSLSFTKDHMDRTIFIGADQPVNTWIQDNVYKWYCNLSINKPVTAIDIIAQLLQNMPIVQDQRYRMFYHATSWSSAHKIVTAGILHDNGRLCLDFGESRSFYLTPDINMALEWCTKNKTRWSNESCILMYYVSNNLHSITNKKYMHFEKPDKDWTNLVTLSR
jgi:hypothetical protein